LLIALSGSGMAFAQKPGGILKMYSIDSPASMSILEESTVFPEGPMMGCERHGIGQIFLKANSPAQKTHSAHRGRLIQLALPQPVFSHGLLNFQTINGALAARSQCDAVTDMC
jgi:hypothetical protein